MYIDCDERWGHGVSTCPSVLPNELFYGVCFPLTDVWSFLFVFLQVYSKSSLWMLALWQLKASIATITLQSTRKGWCMER